MNFESDVKVAYDASWETETPRVVKLLVLLKDILYPLITPQRKSSGTGDQCTIIAVLPSVVAVISEGGRSGAKTYRNERAKCRLHLIKWEIPFTSDSYNEKFFLLFIYLCLSIERVLSIEGLSCRKETPARVRVNVSTSPRHAR